VYGPGILTARNINVNLEAIEPGLIFDEDDCNGFSGKFVLLTCVTGSR
jgi:hypothetical protein